MARHAAAAAPASVFTTVPKVPKIRNVPPASNRADMRTAAFLSGLPRFPSLDHLDPEARTEALNAYLRDFREYTHRMGERRRPLL